MLVQDFSSYSWWLIFCHFSSRLAYYAIFDGHAGAEAAKFAANNLHKNIVQKFPKGWAPESGKRKEIFHCPYKEGPARPSFFNLTPFICSTFLNVKSTCIDMSVLTLSFATKMLHCCMFLGDVVNKDKEIKRCLIDAYRKTDEEFLQEASKQYVGLIKSLPIILIKT